MPEGWDADLPRFDADPKGMATRKASGKVIQWAAKQVPAPRSAARPTWRARTTPTSTTAATSAGRLRGPQHPLRRARARHGRDRERPRTSQGLRAYGGTFLIFSRLHARGDPAGGADEAAVDLGLHARLDRARRGRPDAPADRAARGAARDPAPERAPPGRRERDGARAGASRCARRTRPTRVRAVAPEPAGARPGLACRTTRSSAAPTSCGTSATATPDLILIGDGLRGVALPRGRREARGRRHRGARRVACRAWTRSPSRTRPTATRCCPPSCRARVAVEAASPLGWDRWIGPDGGVPRA